MDCAICGGREIGLRPEDVPEEMQPELVRAVRAALAEALGKDVPVEPGGFRDSGQFTEHIPCEVLTKARRLVAQRFGVRMDDD